jgi:low affinity Fe/Cu permease
MGWLAYSPSTFEWHAVATLLIAHFIQRSGHRDTQALHAKLDELLRAHPAAKTELAKLDDEEPEDIEAFRKRQRNGSVAEP